MVIIFIRGLYVYYKNNTYFYMHFDKTCMALQFSYVSVRVQCYFSRVLSNSISRLPFYILKSSILERINALKGLAYCFGPSSVAIEMFITLENNSHLLDLLCSNLRFQKKRT